MKKIALILTILFIFCSCKSHVKIPTTEKEIQKLVQPYTMYYPHSCKLQQFVSPNGSNIFYLINHCESPSKEEADDAWYGDFSCVFLNDFENLYGKYVDIWMETPIIWLGNDSAIVYGREIYYFSQNTRDYLCLPQSVDGGAMLMLGGKYHQQRDSVIFFTEGGSEIELASYVYEYDLSEHNWSLLYQEETSSYRDNVFDLKIESENEISFLRPNGERITIELES